MALVVFTGGARSGKSAAAQALALRREMDGGRVVVAVFGKAMPDDLEFAERIARHRADRPASFETLEADAASEWMERVPDDCVLVIDCLGTLLGLAMDSIADFDRAIDWILGRTGDTIVVTNEVGDGVVPAYASGRVFRDVLGRANRQLISSADAAWLCIAGRLLDLERLPQEARWPAD